MKYAPKAFLILLAATIPSSPAFAQSEVPAQILPSDVPAMSTPVVPVVPAQAVPTTPTMPAPVAATPTQLNTDSADAFLTSLSEKFGTSKSRLKSLLAKVPPNGRGLNAIEISVISNKLNLTNDEKQVLKARVGVGGTGFNSEDISGMAARLGLNDVETANLAQQLGLRGSAVASTQPMSPATTEGTTLVPANTVNGVTPAIPDATYTPEPVTLPPSDTPPPPAIPESQTY